MVLRRSPKQLAPESYNLLGTGNCRARKIGRWKIFHGNTNGCSSPMRMNALHRIWNAKFARPLPAPDVDGFYLNRRFWFLDGWINHCGYFPSWNLRLFRHGLADTNKLKPATIFPLEIMKSTSTSCWTAASNIYLHQWNIMPSPTSLRLLRSTSGILRGKLPLGGNCSQRMINRCGLRLLGRGWNESAG